MSKLTKHFANLDYESIGTTEEKWLKAMYDRSMDIVNYNEINHCYRFNARAVHHAIVDASKYKKVAKDSGFDVSDWK